MTNEAIQAFIRTLCPSNADVRLEVASPPWMISGAKTTTESAYPSHRR